MTRACLLLSLLMPPSPSLPSKVLPRVDYALDTAWCSQTTLWAESYLGPFDGWLRICPQTWQTSQKSGRSDVLLTQEIPAGSVKRMGLSEELEEVGAHGQKIVREAAGLNLDKSMKLPKFICSPHSPCKVSMIVTSVYKSWSPQPAGPGETVQFWISPADIFFSNLHLINSEPITEGQKV